MKKFPILTLLMLSLLLLGLVISCCGSSDDDAVIAPVNVILANLSADVSVKGADGISLVCNFNCR